MVKPQYIVLFRGDDSNFPGNQEIIVELQTTLDLTGCTAYFKFLDFQQAFSPIPADKKLHLVFGKNDTKRFPLGAMDGEVYIVSEQGQGRRRTVANRVHIVVTNSVDEAYDNTDPQAITVVVTGDRFVKTVNNQTPDANGNVNVTQEFKPFTQTDIFDMNCNDWDFRKTLARVWTALGGKVNNND